MFRQYEDVGELSILDLNKHVEQKNLFLVFVQSLQSVLIVFAKMHSQSCLLVMVVKYLFP